MAHDWQACGDAASVVSQNEQCLSGFKIAKYIANFDSAMFIFHSERLNNKRGEESFLALKGPHELQHVGNRIEDGDVDAHCAVRINSIFKSSTPTGCHAALKSRNFESQTTPIPEDVSCTFK
jgi:hypothetical protein